MNDANPIPGLGPALDLATDRIDAPQLASTVVAEARRRRTRTGLLAAAGTAAAVAIVVATLQSPGPDGEQRPVAPSSPSVTPSGTGSSSPDPVDDGVLPRWDPFTIAGEPHHESMLPRRVDPPESAPSLSGLPLSAAVLAWPEVGQDLRLLGTDGTWRSVPGTANAVAGTLRDVVGPALSKDGRQVAMSTNEGILVVDVTSGERRTIAWPDEIAGPWDTAPALLWLPDGAGFAVLHWQATWLVTLDGEGSKAPYGGTYGGVLAFDPDGTVVERRWEQRDLRVWQNDRVVTAVPFPYWGERLVARHGKAALTGGGDGLPADGGPMVLDAATGDMLAYAPIRDPNSVYSDNGHLTAKGFLDEDTVLLLVGPMDFRTMSPGEETWHLVAWDSRTGTVERLTSGDPGMRDIDVAGDLLAADWQR